MECRLYYFQSFSFIPVYSLGSAVNAPEQAPDAVTVILDKGELEDRLVSVDSRWVLG